MAHIVPFRALRYDPQRVDPAAVVTQPYDKITSQSQERYYASSPYNLVRLILGKHEPADNEQANVYTRAASFFTDWRRQGIFLQDSQPSLYVYSQRFTVPGTARTGRTPRLHRTGPGRRLLVRRRLPPRADSGQAQGRSPATPARNPLPFRTDFHALQRHRRNRCTSRARFAATTEVTDEYDVLHRLWRVSDPALIELVRGKMRDKKLIIADGHHRYETALNYRNERRTAAQPVGAPRRGFRRHLAAHARNRRSSLRAGHDDLRQHE